MLKRIILLVLAVLLFSGAAAWYLFSFFSYDELSGTTVVTVDEDPSAYTVRFVDSDGKPVAGVMANICDDASCILLTSDEEGYARCAVETGSWSLQILKVPEGYTFLPDEKFPLSSGETVIALNKE